MIDHSIAFLDSGVGGLPYADWMRQRRPDLPLTYVADSASFPYGEREPDDVKRAVLQTAVKLFDQGTPRILVLACNTASVVALEALRAMAPCPVVGTVPAIKSAANLAGAIGVLATSRTVSSSYLDGLVEDFAPGRQVHRVAAGDIVRFVEERWLDDGEDGAREVLGPSLAQLKQEGVGSVVLGCTHFIHVMNPIEKELGSGVQVVDSRDGVGRRVLDVLKEAHQVDENAEIAPSGFWVTGNALQSMHRRYAQLHGFQWEGPLT
ncbi:MAG: glutamate racemase [Spirochaetales bacterium]|nr:glutamate racemase [Spirochaetales bacterium]